MTEPPTTPETLPLDQKRRVDHLCDRFEAAWNAGSRPAIEAYLADAAEVSLSVLLCELVLLDVYYRRLRGEVPWPEDYAARFPRLPPAWLAAALAPPTAPGGETPHPAAQTVRLAPPAGTGTRVGGYELMEVLGRGGMGVVWKARQLQANRLVALKLVLAGELAGDADVRRFQEEAEIAAGLDHPNLVPLYEVGEDQGRHFFSMRLIGGGHLGQHLAHFRERPREVAALLLVVARAVQHAHQHGLLHRDLKPGNILLSRRASSLACPPSPPGQAGSLSYEPHVADFGLARRLERGPGLTRSGAVVGTPEYMAPEQARGERNLTTATDVYGLGAVLYTLLTGQPPFRGRNDLETLEQVVNRAAAGPRSLNPRVDRDLETICLKCLHKEPARRYATAAELALDLERYLNHEPIRARPAGRLRHAWSWCRRNPAVAVLSAALLLSLVAGVIVSAGLAWRALAEADTARKQKQLADENADRADREKRFAQRQLYLARMGLARLAWRDGHLERLANLLDATRPSAGAAEEQEDCRHFEWYYFDRLLHGQLRSFQPAGWAGVEAVAVSPDSRRLAASRWNQVTAWDTQSGAVLFSPQVTTAYALAFDATGGRLACGSGSARSMVQQAVFGSGRGRIPVAGLLTVWDVAAGKTLLSTQEPGFCIGAVAFSPDGKKLAGTTGFPQLVGWLGVAVKVWDAETGKVETKLDWGGCTAVAFSPDGSRLLAGGPTAPLKAWDLRTGQETQVAAAEARRLGFTRDGGLLASGRPGDTTVTLQDGTGKAVGTVTNAAVPAAAFFSADGKRLACTGPGWVTLWNVKPEFEISTIHAHTHLSAAAFSDDGRFLVTGGEDAQVKVWDAERGVEPVYMTTPGQQYTYFNKLVFSPDGRRLAADGVIFDLASGRVLHNFGVETAAVGPDGLSLAGIGKDKQLRVWDTESGQLLRDLGKCDGPVSCLAVGEGGRVTAVVAGKVRTWDAGSGDELPCHAFDDPQRARGLAASLSALSADGRRLAYRRDNVIVVCDLETGDEVCRLEGPHNKGSLLRLAFNADGTRLASVVRNEPVIIWDLKTAQQLFAFPFLSENRIFLAFSHDGRRLATGGRGERGDPTVRLWDLETGQETLSIEFRGNFALALAFSRDGKSLAAALAGGGGVKVWTERTDNRQAGQP
jgi:WD40 repeat protein